MNQHTPCAILSDTTFLPYTTTPNSCRAKTTVKNHDPLRKNKVMKPCAEHRLLFEGKPTLYNKQQLKSQSDIVMIVLINGDRSIGRKVKPVNKTNSDMNVLVAVHAIAKASTNIISPCDPLGCCCCCWRLKPSLRFCDYIILHYINNQVVIKALHSCSYFVCM